MARICSRAFLAVRPGFSASPERACRILNQYIERSAARAIRESRPRGYAFDPLADYGESHTGQGYAQRCRRTEARKTAPRPSLMKLFKLLS